MVVVVEGAVGRLVVAGDVEVVEEAARAAALPSRWYSRAPGSDVAVFKSWLDTE